MNASGGSTQSLKRQDLWLTIALWAGAAVALTGLAIAISTLTRAPWIDEFWTLWTGAPGVDPGLFLARMRNEAHPLFYYAYTYLLQNIGLTDLALMRAANVIGIVFVAYALVLAVRLKICSLKEMAIVVALYASSPIFLGLFAELRGYFILFSLSIALGLLFRGIMQIEQYGRDTRTLLLASWGAGLLIFVNLQYYGTLFGGVLTALLIGHFALRRDYKLAALLALVGVLAAVPCVALILVQLPNLPNMTGWIETGDREALMFVVRAVSYSLATNPVAILAAAGAAFLMVRAKKPSEDARALLLLVAGVAAFFAVMLAVNHFKPIIYLNYLFAAGGVLLVVVSRLAADARLPRWTAAAICLVAFPAQMLVVRNGDGISNPGWTKSTEAVAALKRACPASQVYGAHIRPIVHYWAPTQYGYNYYAQRAGFTVEEARQGQTIGPSGACPGIIWITHRPFRDDDMATILGKIELKVDGHAEMRREDDGIIILVTPTTS